MGPRFKAIKLNKLEAISVFIFLFGCGLLAYSFLRTDLVQNNRYVKSWQYERLAKKFPPTHENAMRLRAMAEALREGKEEYSYETNQMPPTIQDKIQNINGGVPDEHK